MGCKIIGDFGLHRGCRGELVGELCGVDELGIDFGEIHHREIEALNRLLAYQPKTIVPGHGPVLRDHAGIAQTRDYLQWLRDSLQGAARRGLDMNEVLKLVIPARFQQLAVLKTEYERSVSHLYPAYELEALPVVPKSRPQ